MGKARTPRCGELPTGLQTVEVAYDLDVDSFNAWAGDCVGCFHRRPDLLLIYRSTLTMHEEESLYLDDASQHMQGADGAAGEGQPAHGSGLGFRRRLRMLLLVLAGMFIYQGLNAVQ